MRSPPLLWYFPYYQHTTGVCGGGGLNKYQRTGADRLQLRLRLRFRRRLTASVRALAAIRTVWEWCMNIRFYRDPATGEPHIYNHGVTEEEVEEVLRRPGEDRHGREGSRVAIGQTRAGRSLRVVYVPAPEPDSIFVITAYALRGKPLAAYRRRQRRKGQR